MRSPLHKAEARWRRLQEKPAAQFLIQLGALWSRHAIPRHAAALAFYTLLVLVPMLLVLTGIGSLWLGTQQVSEQILKLAARTLGEAAAQPLRQFIEQTVQRGSGAGATLVGLLLTLWGASGLLQTIKTSLDEFWEAKPDEPAIVQWLLGRFIAMLGVLLLALLLCVSVVLEVVVQVLKQRLDTLPPLYGLLAWLSRALVPVLATLGFALLYRALPAAKPRWRHALLGAVVAVLLLTLGRSLVSLYIAHSGLATLYGSAGSLVVLLLWVYVSAMLFFLGALISVQLGQWRSRQAASQIVPK